MTARVRTLAVVMTSLLAAAACSSTKNSASPDPMASDSVPTLTTRIVHTYDRDDDAFTQGYEVDGDILYEGTGLEGSSFVRRTSLSDMTLSDMTSSDMTELDRVDLPPDLFGEGITVVGDTLWQITWRDGVAIARDRDSLAERRRVGYDGEGWGLCAREGRLVMSDGSSTLTFRDPTSFEPEGTIGVTLDGSPVDRLNELDCAEDGSVYANVWQSSDIMQIDPTNGAVTAVIDGTPLWDAMSTTERSGADVLNGIAQIPGTDRFLLTGKYWPKVFEVQFTDTATVGQN